MDAVKDTTLPAECPKKQVSKKRKNLLIMATTYFLGTFNDNFFKQATLLAAVSFNLKGIQGLATIIFTLPYMLVSAPGGWFADHFPKKKVVVAVKVLELIAVCIGGLGFLLLKEGDSLFSASWMLILIMLAVMGMHTSIFSPALIGTIPELYPESHVPKANGIVRLVSTLGILSGIALAGFVLETTFDFHFLDNIKGRLEASREYITVAGVIVFIALVGVFASLGLPHYHYDKKDKLRSPFPWLGPIQTWKDLIEIKKDPLLHLAVWGNTYFWFLGSFIVLAINEIGANQLGLSKSVTSGLIVGQMVGIGVGAMLISRKSLISIKPWYRFVIPSLSAINFFMLGIACIPLLPIEVFGSLSLQAIMLALLLLSLGVCGGVFLIPIETFIQLRPAANSKGKTIAASNFASFIGILLSGPLYCLFALFNYPPTVYFLPLFLMTVVFIAWLKIKLRQYEQNSIIDDAEILYENI
ncbi:MAG: nitrate/nitrite transporter [Chlamydiales bacterium]|jgi:acyl-[acyl-carrier-protein]-phospholipid O-acyltransferase/long-chain-fatty-acid--[acyl-carrier-protein] ligase|nr:nitrate/nitrite transporter [Chlamydiales bacterium]